MKKSIFLNMTGDEFKKLIEARDPNDIIDTLQEVLAAFKGIGDNETIAEYVHRVALTASSVPDEMIVGKEKARAIVADAIAAAEERATAEENTEEENADEPTAE